ncbi:MAG: hypothetical protein HYZ14_01505 [Bacteroidetes bacterium]|nr:hypothetical protein [Bacteroidota bacterium]
MTTQIRRFNESGIEQFRNILHRIKSGDVNDVPPSLLTDAYVSEILHTDKKIEQKLFLLKDDMVKYLSDKISTLPGKNLLYDRGLWTWLAAFYFDSICPKNSGGKRKVRDENKYILNTEEWQRYYRHLLASPTRLYNDLGANSKIYLAGKPDVPGDLFEQLASRQEIATCRSLIEAATIMYWDDTTGKIKKGVRNKDGAGVLRRFVKATIPQFQMTYDLNSMSGDDVVQLLPSEYQKWIT